MNTANNRDDNSGREHGRDRQCPRRPTPDHDMDKAGKEEKAQAPTKGKEWLTTRDVLWILVFTGFAVNYMIRINLNIAIVAMVRQRPSSTPVGSASAECQDPTAVTLAVNTTDPPAGNWSSGAVPANLTEEDATPNEPPDLAGFEWNEYEQGLILGAFFWLHWCTQVPGGLLAQRYGTKLIYGLSNFCGVLFCFVIPPASYMGWRVLIAMRCLQGIVAGFAWPAMHNMTAKWIPPNERSKFVTAYLGSSVGAALTFPLCGYIIDLCGWDYVFYVCGVLGSVWFACWWLLVYDSPAQHPRISAEERDYILNSLGQTVSKGKDKPAVPWKAILTSVPVWMNILAQWGGIWGLFTLMTHAPSYFKYIHGWNIRMTGLLSGMPHMLRMLFAYVFSMLGDFLLRTERMSRTNVRKLATALCTIGQAVFLLALAYSGCNANAAIVFLTLATAVHGTVSSGPLASFVDISPNYASLLLGLANTAVAVVGFMTPAVVGLVTFNNINYLSQVTSVTLGICGMIAVLPGFISPAIVGVLTNNNNTVGQWQLVFLIAVAMLLVSGVAYVLFSRSDLEPWNNPDAARSDAELKALRSEEPPPLHVIHEKAQEAEGQYD